MTSIDDLFRGANAPTKRKFDSSDAQAAYKATKTSHTSDAKGGHTNGHHHAATVEDDSDVEAGPTLPPDEDDADYGPNDGPEDDEAGSDDEGRFFGGGVTAHSREAMDYLDTADGEDYVEEKHDAAWARRLAGNLEKKISKNAQQRARFEGQPERFMESEAALDTEVRGVSVLTDYSELYEEWARAGGAKGVVELLAHDNADIAISAMESIAELLDEDVEVEQGQWDAVVEAMLEADLVSLLAQNFERYDEVENENDRQGVYHSLAVLEALGSQTAVAEKAGTEEIIQYLLKRIQAKEDGTSQNKQYAAEVLQVLLQDSQFLRKRTIKLGAVDVILQTLSPYRRKDPESNSLEEEYASNLFNALVCLVRETDGKQAFLDGEGVELMLIMVREGKMSKSEALKVLDHATVGSGQAVCEKIVESAGLKTIFGLFKKKPDRQGTENLLDILSAMLRLLPGESPERIRVLAKFAEKDYDKVSKLLDWRSKFASDVAKVDADISKERSTISVEDQDDRADEWDLRRMDAGLFGLQTVNIILAWLAAEDHDARNKVSSGLEKGAQSIADLTQGLRAQLAEVDQQADEDLAEMLQALIDALT
ncbi:DUF1716-domain-containing protein [Myriangium duriaei CBS 260.36]|uniref:DUF1716-domain-containing protein n=1 Tax=Myriangium duriaei CBS 260.36 TaxID=1168546 RepID=A0A9P4JAS4_9PEZI|nr:DUF1716-domain-containing protein [Myriangium duriaei CBS 260.36]